MRKIVVPGIVCALVLSGTLATAQLTLLNGASGGARFVTTTGTAHSIDTTNFRIGSASCLRAAGAANASYLSTGIALDPLSNGGCTTADPGFTIQFWYRPVASTALEYIFGDNTWTGVNGAFRCFRNGAAGAGNLYIRGPLVGQKITTGTPLTLSLDPNGWVHIALVINTKTNLVAWFINGAANGTPSTATISGKGTNLTCLGYNGSSSGGSTGNYDDFRVYDWARTAADIAADYAANAAGNGPSGCPNQPDHGYYEFEASVNPHLATIGLKNEVQADFTRLFTTGDTIQWAAGSPAAGPFAGTCILNIGFGGPGSPRADAYWPPKAMVGGPYVTGIVPGLEVGHCFSKPQAFAIAWPDGLKVGPAVAGGCGGVTIPIAYAYGSGTGPMVGIKMPPLNFVDGDRVDLQWVTIDPTYPGGIATTNRATFEFVKALPGPHAHVEARGSDVIQETGFWEIWNTGTVPIKEICIDFTPLTTATTWSPTGALNSGGTLAAGDSIRFQTDVICDLTPAANPRYTLDATSKKLCFKFTCPPAPADGFQGPTNHFIFDCATVPQQAGNLFAGAIVTVTWCDSTVKILPLVADTPNQRAQVDF